MTDAETNHAAKILEALAEVDKATKAGIVAELELLRPSFEIALEEAAAKLATAHAALDLPAAQVNELDARIAEFQVKADEWHSRIDDEDVEQSVTAAFYHQGFTDHIGKLVSKKGELQATLDLLKEDHDLARNAMVAAQGELNLFELNLLNPYLHIGQQTETYKAFRVGSFSQWIGMLNDRLPGERSAFTQGLDSIAVSTGYRTDDLTERIRQHEIDGELEDFRRNFPNSGRSNAPTGAEIRDRINNMMETAASESYSSVEYIQPVVAQPVANRPHMQMPRASDALRTMQN